VSTLYGRGGGRGTFHVRPACQPSPSLPGAPAPWCGSPVGRRSAGGACDGSSAPPAGAGAGAALRGGLCSQLAPRAPPGLAPPAAPPAPAPAAPGPGAAAAGTAAAASASACAAAAAVRPVRCKAICDCLSLYVSFSLMRLQPRGQQPSCRARARAWAWAVRGGARRAFAARFCSTARATSVSIGARGAGGSTADLPPAGTAPMAPMARASRGGVRGEGGPTRAPLPNWSKSPPPRAPGERGAGAGAGGDAARVGGGFDQFGSGAARGVGRSTAPPPPRGAAAKLVKLPRGAASSASASGGGTLGARASGGEPGRPACGANGSNGSSRRRSASGGPKWRGLPAPPSCPISTG